MYTFITILIIVVCSLMILVVLIQKPKGGGLSSNFSGSNQIMGAKRTADFIEKFTWVLSLILLVLSLGINLWIPRNEVAAEGSEAAERAKTETLIQQPTNLDNIQQDQGTETNGDSAN